jgi:hypothetical protein
MAHASLNRLPPDSGPSGPLQLACDVGAASRAAPRSSSARRTYMTVQRQWTTSRLLQSQATSVENEDAPSIFRKIT